MMLRGRNFYALLNPQAQSRLSKNIVKKANKIESNFVQNTTPKYKIAIRFVAHEVSHG